MKFHIRDISIDPGLALAPMEGVTDLTFRRLVRQIGGCGLTVTEFIPAAQLVNGVPKFHRMAEFDRDESPIAIQVYGRDPEVLAAAAKIAQDKGAHIVDLNMGCPSKRVCRNSGGSGLMREPALVQKIVRAMRAAVDVPFTVKMRAGWDRESLNAPELAYMCQEEGVEAVTVHWRTRQELYGGVRDLGPVREVVERVRIPVMANGDVVDVDSALQTLEETGAAGLMIGRGAIRNPWLFHQVDCALRGVTPRHVGLDEKERILLGYFDTIRPLFRTENGALGRMKKISRYFTEGLEGGGALRTALFHSQTVDEAYGKAREYFEEQRQRAGHPVAAS